MQERLRAFGAEPEPGAEPPTPRSSTVADRLALAGCAIGVLAVAVFAVIGALVTIGWLVG